MSLYRKEALDARKTALYGRVVLKSPPGMGWIILLVIILFALVLGALFGLRIEGVPLWQWLSR